jgi:hypothetical protein
MLALFSFYTPSPVESLLKHAMQCYVVTEGNAEKLQKVPSGGGTLCVFVQIEPTRVRAHRGTMGECEQGVGTNRCDSDGPAELPALA